VLSKATNIIIEYLYLLIGVLIISNFIYLNNEGTIVFADSIENVASARNLLSALIPSEATIFTIVLTASLLTMQLAAQSYSPRVIDIFIKNINNKIIIIIYACTLIYSLILLRIISEINIESLRYLIFISLNLAIFAFLGSILYSFNIINLLKPNTIMDYLSKQITKEALISINYVGDDRDPLQPIIDIMRSSLLKHDYEMIVIALKAIESRIKKILNDRTLTSKDESEIAMKVINKMANFSRISIKSDDSSSSDRTIFSIGFIGVAAAKNCRYNMTGLSIEVLRDLAKDAIEKNNDMSVHSAIFGLSSIGDEEAKNKLTSDSFEDITDIILFFEETGKVAIEKKQLWG